MPAWKDITSYSQNDKQRVPASFELRVTPRITLVVTRHRHYPPDVWCSQCHTLWDTTALDSKDLSAAKTEAEDKLRSLLTEALSALNL